MLFYYHFTDDAIMHGPFLTPGRCSSDAASKIENAGKTMIVSMKMTSGPVLIAVASNPPDDLSGNMTGAVAA